MFKKKQHTEFCGFFQQIIRMQLMQLTLDFCCGAPPHPTTKNMFPPSPDPANKPPPCRFHHKQPLLELAVQMNYCSRQKKVSKRVTRWCAKCGLHVIEKIKAPRLHSAAAVNAQGPPTPHPLTPPPPHPYCKQHSYDN